MYKNIFNIVLVSNIEEGFRGIFVFFLIFIAYSFGDGYIGCLGHGNFENVAIPKVFF